MRGPSICRLILENILLSRPGAACSTDTCTHTAVRSRQPLLLQQPLGSGDRHRQDTGSPQPRWEATQYEAGMTHCSTPPPTQAFGRVSCNAGAARPLGKRTLFHDFPALRAASFLLNAQWNTARLKKPDCLTCRPGEQAVALSRAW